MSNVVGSNLPTLWTRGVVTRLEGGILVGLYGLYLAEQVLSETLTTAQDEFRFVILVVVLPLVLVFFCLADAALAAAAPRLNKPWAPTAGKLPATKDT